MDRIKGNSNTHHGEKVMALYFLLRTISPQASKIVSANFDGPRDERVREAFRKLDGSSDGNCIINRLVDEAKIN